MPLHTSSSSRETLPLSVDNIGFMLDRLGRDCAPLQFLRELTQNSIEAILRTPSRHGSIVWDVDWNRYDLSGDGIYKLSVVDDGDGMTGPEMVKYINQLSSSISQQSLDGNFGVGAKIAAATRNHAGLIYLSWKGGHGAMIHLWRDPDSGQYGLRQFEHPDGTFAYWLPLDDTLKPEGLRDRGTMVVLLGNDPKQHTMSAPPGTASPSRWIAKYLNTRYFKFPEGINVKAREGWDNNRADVDRNLLRTITGQQPYLDEHSIDNGQVRLSSAMAYWWILRDEAALRQNSGFVNSNGHVAALFNDELYEIETSRSGVARLQQFGIVLGYDRVVIYVQPSPSSGEELTSNTARTQLLLNSEPLPWAYWAAEFRDNIPKPIRALIEEAAAAATGRDHTQAIKERLKQISDLFRLSRYKPTPTGDFLVDEDTPRRGGKPLIEELKRRQRRSGSRGSSEGGGRAGDIYATFATEAGEPALKIKADPFPEPIWVSVTNGTRAPGFLEDRAAKFLPEQNQIQINADFRVFTDMIDRFCKLYRDAPRATVEEIVHEWFEQSLIEAVMGVQSLEGAREWSVEDIGRALSEEALTVAVLPRYHLDFAIRRALGTRLGSLKKAGKGTHSDVADA